MEKIKEFIRHNKLHLIVALMIVLLFVPFLLHNEGISIFSGDSYQQSYHEILGIREKILSGNLGLWDWSVGYGASSYTSLQYVSVVNPFNLLTILFPVQYVAFAISMLNCIKVFLVYYLAFKWLHEMSNNKYTSSIAALIIAFGGWVLYLFNLNLYLDAYPLFFLTLYVFEKNYSTQKWRLMVILMVWLLWINFYMFYMFVFFFAIYVLYRAYIKEDKFKDMIIVSFKYAGICLLSVILGAVIWLPLASIILDTPRVQGLSEGIDLGFVGLKRLYRFFSSYFAPISNRHNVNAFVVPSSANGVGWDLGCSLYATMLTPLILPLLFKMKKCKEKYALISINLLCYIAISFFIFYYIFQGALETRWFFIVNIFNALAIMYVLQSIIDGVITKKAILLCSVLCISLLVFFSVTTLYFGETEIRETLKLQIMISLGLLAMYTIALLWCKFKLLYLILIVECCYIFLIQYHGERPLGYDVFTIDYEKYEIFERVKQEYDGMSRILYEGVFETSPNFPFSLDFRGSSFYSSLYNFEQNEFLERCLESWSCGTVDNDYYIDNFMGSKHYIARNKDFIPYGFSFSEQVGSYSIYTNDHYIELGYPVNEAINQEYVASLPHFERSRILPFYWISDNYEGLEYQYHDNIETLYSWIEPKRVEFYISDKQEVYLVHELFYMPFVEIEIHYIDGSITELSYYQLKYLPIYIDNTSFDIEKVIIKNNDHYNTGSTANYYMDSSFEKYTKWYNDIKDKMFHDVSVNAYGVKGKIEIDKDDIGTVLTNIPYDKGWKCYDNGKEIPTEKVNLGFVGIILDKGYHEVSFVYVPRLFVEGSLLSLAGLAILVFPWELLLRKRK